MINTDKSSNRYQFVIQSTQVVCHKLYKRVGDVEKASRSTEGMQSIRLGSKEYTSKSGDSLTDREVSLCVTAVTECVFCLLDGGGKRVDIAEQLERVVKGCDLPIVEVVDNDE